jgi:hypothetical protein
MGRKKKRLRLKKRLEDAKAAEASVEVVKEAPVKVAARKPAKKSKIWGKAADKE